MLSMKLKFFTAFRSQTDGQTEVINRSLENLLRKLVGEQTRSWDFKLGTAEFAYNTAVNRTTEKSPREIVYDFRPRQLINLIPISDHIRVSDSASSFASYVHDLHKEVMDKIAQSNASYKLRANVRKRFKIFNVGEYVNVRNHPERFPLGTVKKLHVVVLVHFRF